MDIASWIGLIAGFGLLGWSIWIGAGGNVKIYFDTPSVIMVLGGSIFTVLITQALDRYFSLFAVIRRGLFTKRQSIPQVIEQIVKLSERARREGVLSLEGALKQIDDPFLANGLQLVIDGTGAAEIEAIMSAELEAMDLRHSQGKTILDLFAKYAPAFGMIGTLVGLVSMLSNMSDPKAIGPGMAVAILTTLYGAIIANMICLPLADKLNYRHEEEMLVRTVVMKGILSLQAGDNPRITQAKLAVYMPGPTRKALNNNADAAKAKTS